MATRAFLVDIRHRPPCPTPPSTSGLVLLERREQQGPAWDGDDDSGGSGI